jgi:hypothetical protein
VSKKNGTIKVPKTGIRKNNPVAKVLMNTCFRKQVVQSSKIYSRKGNRYSDRDSGYYFALFV